VRVLHGHTAMVLSVAVSGDTIISGSYDETIRVWNLNDGELRMVLNSNETGSSSPVFTVAFGTYPFILSGHSDNSDLHVWDINTGECEKLLEFSEADEDRDDDEELSPSNPTIFSIAAAPNGKVVVGYADSSVRVWDIQSETSVTTEHKHSDSDAVFVVATSSTHFASGSTDGSICLYEY
jgi:WD40 repeat protein